MRHEPEAILATPAATATATVVPLILCGGSGTRLWPMSRQDHPKQLLSLVGEHSLLQQTVQRLLPLAAAEVRPPVLVCNEAYRFIVAAQLRQIGLRASLVLEPEGRNTAPALTLGALAALDAGGDPVLVAMPSDHVIQDEPAFRLAVAQAVALAQQGGIVTLGIEPTAPATGYGYIQHALGPDGHSRIVRFIEKPDLATAQRLLSEHGFVWNSGVFVVRASVWLSALALCQPQVHQCLTLAWQGCQKDGDFIRVQAQAFAASPSVSIDVGVMERLQEADIAPSAPMGYVVPLSARWSDVGSWDAVWQTLPQDEHGNAARGDVVLEGCQDSLVWSTSRLVSCAGVDGMVVIETPDAVMVVPKSDTQRIRGLVQQLQAQQRPEVTQPRKMERPWGSYDAIDHGERFQVKRITVRPGAALSLQMHHHRAEHWIVVRGTARVTRGEEVFLLTENQSTYIPLGVTHRLENPGQLPLELIEVQSGSYLGEDDIVRMDDRYGR